VRDAFFASPSFPRLLNPGALKGTIAKGVRDGKFGYASKVDGGYQGVVIEDPEFKDENVELSEEVVLLPREKALGLKKQPAHPIGPGTPQPGSGQTLEGVGSPSESPSARCRLSWEGAIPPQKWAQFYMKVLTHFAKDPSLRLHVRFEVEPEAGVSQSRLEDIKIALQELGLDPTAIRTDRGEGER
jgi:hypothetical protein